MLESPRLSAGYIQTEGIPSVWGHRTTAVHVNGIHKIGVRFPVAPPIYEENAYCTLSVRYGNLFDGMPYRR